MTANNAQALVYAAFMMDGNANADQLITVCKAAGIQVHPSLAKVFAKQLEQESLTDLLSQVSFGGGGGGGGDVQHASQSNKEEAAAAEEEEEESEDDDMGFGLFD